MTRLVLLLLLAAGYGCGKRDTENTNTPRNAIESSPQTQPSGFDGNSAFQFLTSQTQFGPRNPNSAGHRNCLNFIESEARKYTMDVQVQRFTVKGYDNEVLRLANIFARFNPAAQRRILLVAHWDTRPRADQESDPKKKTQPIIGANDGASGVAVLLELARQFKNSPPPIGVDLLFVDGEDYGKEGDSKYYLLGSAFFGAHLPPGYAPEFGIVLDMVGDKQLELRKEMHSLTYGPDIVDLVWNAAQDLGVKQFVQANQGFVTDDHLPLNRAGIKTIDIIDFDYPDESNRFWHTHNDIPENCSSESLAAVGTVLMDIIYHRLK